MTTFDIVYSVITSTAAVFSIMMNISPILAIVRLEKAGTVGSGTITFFGAQMYNCVTWATYGFLLWSWPLMIPCTLGNCVSMYSMLVFLTVARREEKTGKQLLSTTYAKSVLTAVFFIVISWIHLFLCVGFLSSGNPTSARTMTGWEGSVACVVMLSAPLGVFKEIVRLKNAESLQPVMVGCASVNTTLWTIAGFMKMDPFLIIPNGLCFLACAAQAALLLKYGRRPPENKEVPEAIAAVPFD